MTGATSTAPPAASPPPGSVPRNGLLLGLVFVFAVAWLAGLLLPLVPPPAGPPELADWHDVEAVIDTIVADPSERVVVVMGDSVVAGSFLEAQHGLRWDELRLVPLMAHAVAPGVSVGIHELSQPGMLPSDLEVLIARLAERDSEGRIELLVQLTPRYFSRAYADPAAFALPFMAAEGSGLVRPLPFPETPGLLRDLMASRGGLAGLRSRLGLAVEALAPDLVALQVPVEPLDMASALYQLRVRPHFLQLDTSLDNPQRQALERVLDGARQQGRPVTLFVTPLNEDFLVPRTGAGLVYDATIELGKMVEDDGIVRLVQSNTAVMGPDDFLDHCHPTAAGDRVLAVHLLEVLGIPSTMVVSPGRKILPPEETRAYILGAVSQGDQDGVGAQVRFQEPQDMVALGPDDLVIADTGNHCLKRVRTGRRTAEVWVGARGQPGLSDGQGAAAAFHSPSRLASDGEGGVFVLDAGSDTLRWVSAEGVVTSLPPYDQDRGPGSGTLVDLASWQGEAWVLDMQQRAVMAVSPAGGAPRTVLLLGMMEVSSIAVDFEGDLWLLAGRARPDQLWRVPRAKLGGDQPFELSVFEPIVQAVADGDLNSVRGRSVAMGELPMLAPHRVVASSDTDQLLVLDRSWDQALTWLVQPKGGRGFLLDPPGEDALQHWPLPGLDIPTFGVGRGDLFWLGRDRSYLVRWNRRLLTGAWELGAEGYSLDIAPRPGALRLAVLGTSMPGAVGGMRNPAGTTGVSTWIERGLREHPLVAGRPLDVYNLCSAGQPLIHSVTGALAQDPSLLHAAVIFVDAFSLHRIDQQDRGTAWDEQGFPIPVGTDHPAPWAAPAPVDESIEVDPTGARHLTRILGALARHAEAHGIQVVLVDLLPLDDDDGFGIESDPTGERARQSRLLVETCEALGLPLVEPWASVGARLPARHPVVVSLDDHHYTARGYELIADRLVPWLAPWLVPSFERASGDAGDVPSSTSTVVAWVEPPPSTIDYSAVAPLLSEQRISSWRREGRAGLVLDVSELEEAPPEHWRLALWAGLTHAPSTAGALELSVVEFANHDEYGANAWDSLGFQARFEVAAEQRASLRDHGAALLADPGSQHPDWLVPLTNQPGR